MAELPLAPVKRLAKVNDRDIRVGDDALLVILPAAENFIKKLSVKAGELAKYAGRKTIKDVDVRTAAKSLGIEI